MQTGRRRRLADGIPFAKAMSLVRPTLLNRCSGLANDVDDNVRLGKHDDVAAVGLDYPQSLVKKLCGAEVLEVLAFNCGLIFTVCSVVGTAALLASFQRRTVESVLWTNAKQNR